ncbi:MAG: type II 3-dehydroquinate dehydratase [Alphaproteobacteria bacterium]|nr:type II 3-dehydroquinate dehydratase [Alphaproteobacteria bacterium]|tara:strand:- start:624 stop:1178 length:555 start_codon:yes stop_codon:yes gene_type:complete
MPKIGRDWPPQSGAFNCPESRPVLTGGHPYRFRTKPLAKRGSLWVLNGPNLNLLGEREPGIYGGDSLADIEKLCAEAAETAGFDLTFRQTNHEGEMVAWIQDARTEASGVAINAGAYTHTSVAVHDALRLLDIPIVEVHLSNIFAREEFRHKSYVSAAATGVVCGFGTHSYILAITALAARMDL